MTQITIHKAELADLSTVQQIGRETFFETFAEANTEADMQKYLTENFNDAKVLAELSHPDSQFFIAWEGNAPIGYLKINTGEAQTEPQGETALEIERIYVKNAYHGKSVGQKLYERALAVAHQENKTLLWLGVWEENPKAIRFYEKNGFVAFGKLNTIPEYL
ncbi:GNAT family N-acetyltransferase [Dyadobacter chenwenxiniae]|uniref:GNAT family N-acetyltransferase n=1 Tax=Dyadobacter chenwenxiniae TaxID=2906456 RepID=A0A9X1PR03_9BACT|nr:GNAT family N-acetyltransferase [Dyadobacter chenwenxiniae]MCF0065827.1 GNAT family N-acetyltransferase [Dyadobacter chenwenxiniae]UON84074.1 GNAT family N-acetyltransferase [Dyadobacter chenwenxiniae]